MPVGMARRHGQCDRIDMSVYGSQLIGTDSFQPPAASFSRMTELSQWPMATSRFLVTTAGDVRIRPAFCLQHDDCTNKRGTWLRNQNVWFWSLHHGFDFPEETNCSTYHLASLDSKSKLWSLDPSATLVIQLDHQKNNSNYFWENHLWTCQRGISHCQCRLNARPAAPRAPGSTSDPVAPMADWGVIPPPGNSIIAEAQMGTEFWRKKINEPTRFRRGRPFYGKNMVLARCSLNLTVMNKTEGQWSINEMGCSTSKNGDVWAWIEIQNLEKPVCIYIYV